MDSKTEMTINEIKAAVNAGKTVYCGTRAYIVIRNSVNPEDYLIKCTINDYCIGLHGVAGTEYENKLNGTGFWVDEMKSVWSVLQQETPAFDGDPNTYQWVQTFKTRNLAMIAVREQWRDGAFMAKEYPTVEIYDDLPTSSERRARRSTVEMVARDEDNDETLIEWTITMIALPA
jgi:hypothetical protein